MTVAILQTLPVKSVEIQGPSHSSQDKDLIQRTVFKPLRQENSLSHAEAQQTPSVFIIFSKPPRGTRLAQPSGSQPNSVRRSVRVHRFGDVGVLLRSLEEVKSHLRKGKGCWLDGIASLLSEMVLPVRFS
jgi:hypothetical protein